MIKPYKDKKSDAGMSWRTATIFISSTFLDMNEERDVLNNYILPKLNEHFRKHRIIIQLIDLRWGVRTADIDDELSRDNKVLSVCFDEIERSRPFFVALLGDRYGYDNLDEEVLKANTYRFNTVIDAAHLYGRSVTELEILYGSLSHPDKQLLNSVFCMRTADYEGMTEAVKSLYMDKPSKMKQLKELITAECIEYNCSDNIINYSVSKWDNSTNRFELFDKSSFGEILYAKLERLISKNFNTLDKVEISFPEELYREQKAFLYDGKKAFGMNARIDSLLERSSHLTIIQGESGIGKSTLLKHIAIKDEYENKAQQILYYNADLSARCHNIRNMFICWIYQISHICGFDVSDICEQNELELEKTLEQGLQICINQGMPFWIIIDSYDSLHKNPITESLSFLRFATKSFVSTLLDTKINFHRNIETDMLIMHGLCLCDAEQMTRDLFKKLHKEWYPMLWDNIKNKFNETINPLWIELAVNTLSSLSSNDFSKIHKQKSNGTDALEQYLLSMVNDFPKEVEHLFGYFFNKAFTDENWTISEQYLLWLIALSRKGIREVDLMAMTKKQDWDSLLFARLRYYFHSCVQESGIYGCWGVKHDIYKKVIEANIRGTGKRMDINFTEMLHNALGHHYIHCNRQYDLRISECIYHLIQGNDKLNFAYFLLNSDTLNDVEGEYTNAIREIVDYINMNNDVKINHYQAPKDMPIPEVGYIHNDAIGWLMDIFHHDLGINNESIGRLIKIFATDVTKGLLAIGDVSSSYYLNLRLLSVVKTYKNIILEDVVPLLESQIALNIKNAQATMGHSDDIVFTKMNNKGVINEEPGFPNKRINSKDNSMNILYLFVATIECAQQELFKGNYIGAITQCNEIIESIKNYNGIIPEEILKEGKEKALLCLADSYLQKGDGQRALEIYKDLELCIDENSFRWLLLQERIYQIYYNSRDPKCLAIAKQYLIIAEQNFYNDKSQYENSKTLIQAYNFYIKALRINNADVNFIERKIAQAERFFKQVQNEYSNHTQIIRFYSHLKEFEGEFFYEIGKKREAKEALDIRLHICEYLSRTEMQNFNAARDYAKSNEDLGCYYVSEKDYKKAHIYFSEAIRLIRKWDDSEEKQYRLSDLYIIDSETLVNALDREAATLIGNYIKDINSYKFLSNEIRVSYIKGLNMHLSRLP